MSISVGADYYLNNSLTSQAANRADKLSASLGALDAASDAYTYCATILLRFKFSSVASRRGGDERDECDALQFGWLSGT